MIAFVKKKSHGHLEHLGHLGMIGVQIEPRSNETHHRRHPVTTDDQMIGQEPDDLDRRAGEADLFLGFSQRSPDDIRIPRLETPTGKTDLPGVMREVSGATGQQDRQPRFALHERHQNRGGDGIGREERAQAFAPVGSQGAEAPVGDRITPRDGAHAGTDQRLERGIVETEKIGGSHGVQFDSTRQQTAPGMTQDFLDALSPVDGRYAERTAPLRAHLSEAALIRERIRLEAEWLLALAAERPPGLPAAATIPNAVIERAKELAKSPPGEAAAAVKGIEQRTNHDVKAVEYYVRDQLAAAGASPAVLELVHFGCTSEDLNNLAYARLLRSARALLVDEFATVLAKLSEWASTHAALPMLSRTHGQTASPTTLGKEFANVAARVGLALARWQAVPIRGKWNGAVGNFNAHRAAMPEADWPAISRRFVESMNLVHNPLTTQIEPHDWIGEYADALAALDVILIDFARDVWGYISLGYLRQRAVAGEVGSSTMPHKVNPIDFENAEGNFGIANALLRHFADKLPISRWQRDLTDSTVLRNVGVALGHVLIALQALQRGLTKIAPDPVRLAADLDEAWEVLGEAVQTALRAHGVPDGYELLKAFTRGQRIDESAYREFVASLPLPAPTRDALAALRPASYLGLAAELARGTLPVAR